MHVQRTADRIARTQLSVLALAREVEAGTDLPDAFVMNILAERCVALIAVLDAIDHAVRSEVEPVPLKGSKSDLAAVLAVARSSAADVHASFGEDQERRSKARASAENALAEILRVQEIVNEKYVTPLTSRSEMMATALEDALAFVETLGADRNTEEGDPDGPPSG